MMTTAERIARTWLTGVVCGALAACGGGGGVDSAGSAPPPVSPTQPTSPTAPTAPATPSPADREAAASLAAKAMNAQYAYDNGLTGKGVTIAIIDTGIDRTNSEFAGRLSADSRSFPVTVARCGSCAGESVLFDLQDVQGHGTQTASIAAAAKDGSGIAGVAPEATLLALKIASPDMVGVTATSTIGESAGAPALGNVAPAIGYAVDKGAFVLSMSFNGYVGGTVALDQKAAMDLVRQNDRLVVQSLPNSVNEDGFADSPTYGQNLTRNLVGADLSNKDWFLFGVRVDERLQAPAGNGVPGELADRTLAVVATDVPATMIGGATVTVTGNSFAAPAIAGAAALLKQYWPQLGGREISRILLDTATDLGASGVDQVYGAGLLNVEKALKAQAPTIGISRFSALPVENTALIFSPAFGGASGQGQFASAAGQAVVLDRYGRDYRLSVGALAGAFRPDGLRLGDMAVQAISAAPPMNQGAILAYDRIWAGDAHVPVARNGRFALGLGRGATVTGLVGGLVDSSPLVTGRLFQNLGLAEFGTSLRFAARGYAVAMAAARTDARDGGSAFRRVEVQTPGGIRFGLAAARERNAALGMRGTGAFAIDGARSLFASLGWTGSLGAVRLTGEGVVGRTRVSSPSDMLRFDGAILSTGFRLQADKPLLGGLALLGLTSPMTVSRALLSYTAPVAYDAGSGQLVTRRSRFDLAPVARQTSLELGWTRALDRAVLSLGAAYSANSANQPGLDSVAGWVRLGAAF